jgi:uncharacterized protein YoxC
MVYWMNGSCTPEEREVIKSGLDTALGILAGAAAKLEGDYPEELEGFSSLRFVKASDVEAAQIIVTDADVGTGGRTSLTVSDRWIIPPAEVEIGCDLASIGVSAVIVVTLHELGHALGLGHTGFQEYGDVYELMYPVISRVMYPSTLDLYAIYQLVIKGYSGSSVSLPDWLPYAQVSPQGLIPPGEEGAATLPELERRIQNLESDVQVIERRLEGLEERVAALENKSSALEERMSEAEKALARASESFERLNASLMQLENATEEQGKLLKDAIANLSTGLGELKLNLSRAQREWAENLTALMREQAALERELASQRRELDEKLLGTSQEVSKISRRMDNMSSEVEGLRLRISNLEKALEAKDLEITLLYRWSMILLLLLAASMIIAVVALIRGRGKVRKEGGESALIWGYA